MATRNKITGIIVGQYGTIITLQAVDKDGNVVSLANYTGVTVRALSPDARTTLSFTGSIVGDGTSGQFTITPTSNNTFDRDGTWEGQAQFTGSGVLDLTVIFEIEIEKKI